MKSTHIAFAVLLAHGAQANAGELSDGQVEKILGLSGVSHAPSKAIALDTQYLDKAGQKLFSLRVGDPTFYDVSKGSGKNSEPVPGLGQEAFARPKLKQVCARTATTAACADALFMDPKVTQQHLIELVRAAL
jgi:hypothetical protein